VRLSLGTPGGRRITLAILQPGALFGLAAVAADDTYDTFADALTAIRLYHIDRAEVREHITGDPALGVALLESLVQHAMTVSRQIGTVAFKSVPARLATLLLDMARAENGRHTIHVPRHSHRQLAERINAYRETVTRVINEFRDARLLSIDHASITLLNRSQLEELANGAWANWHQQRWRQ
jgi:CRP-like cAMP-binding protein